MKINAITKEEASELQDIAIPIINFLSEKYAHPYATVVITSDRVELFTTETSIPIPSTRSND